MVVELIRSSRIDVLQERDHVRMQTAIGHERGTTVDAMCALQIR